MNAPLAGVTVADFTELLPGPFLTGAMAEMGARVVKVERPGGDRLRQSSPGTFEIINRGKESIELDLKKEPGRAEAMKIVQQADVLVESFRPGKMRQLGFGYDELAQINPQLIYLSISGYGQFGPMRDAPGHDLNYLAQAGIISLCGHPAGEPEHTFGLPVADLASGIYGLATVNAALFQRTQTQAGQYIDLSITDCLAHWVNPRHGVYNHDKIGDMEGQRRIALSRPAYGVFACLDGAITIAALEDHFWQSLCRVLPLGEFSDSKFRHLSARRAQTAQINDALAQALAPYKRDDAVALLAKHDIPVSPVLSVSQAVASDHFTARELMTRTAGGPAVRFPVKLAGSPAALPAAPSLNDLKGQV